uniref:Putative monoacylglycerol lipase abhd2 n=1 Tax=Xenopsylla cheopis TaxID=163159 RepID=A0A6M2E0Q7_XENCH
MSPALLAVIAVILCILFRILNVNTTPGTPRIWCKDETFLEAIYKIAPLLREPYVPPRLWGFSGHVQTIVHSIVGRVKCPLPLGERVYLSLSDGSTLTYDLYKPLSPDKHEDEVTLAVCPGIGNSSESVYIRTFVHYAQCYGYRCAVLNHIGALSGVPVTSSRIFSYGHTDDYNEMIRHLQAQFPRTKIVCVGYSLGGNIITKYLGEKSKIKNGNIIGGISICQGYNAIEGTKWLLNWQNFRRFYLYVLTESVKTIILKHRHILLSDEMKLQCQLNERDIAAAATLPELDDAYTRRVHKFPSVNALYKWSSCINYIPDIETPMVFINAKDDPLLHDTLLEPIRKFADTSRKMIYIELSHGGHLGFFEGGLIYPNPVTWIDRAVISIVGGLLLAHNERAIKPI